MLKLIAIMAVLCLPGYGQFFGGSSNAKKIQGRNVKPGMDSCADGNQIIWVAASSWFTCGTAAGGGNVNAAGTLTANLPVIGSGSTNVAVGTRSGNTTEFATVTGSKTASKQLTFDASGNVIVSAYDVGAAGGSTSAFALTDMQTVRTSDTRLTIGGSCSSSAPCNVRFGNTVYAFTGSATADISSGSGTVYIYVTSAGALVVGYNSAPVPTCSAGCTATSSITAFPADSIPLYTWTATSGVWDATVAAFDKRAMYSAKPLAAGSNITITESGGVATIASTASGGLGYALKYGTGHGTDPISDATTYYIGNPTVSNNSWLSGSVPYYYEGAKIAVPKAGSVKRVSWDMAHYNTGTFTSEAVTLSLCIANAAAGSLSGESCTQLTNTMAWTGANQYGQHGVITTDIAVSEGDRLLIKLVTPTWTTKATGVAFQGYIYIE